MYICRRYQTCAYTQVYEEKQKDCAVREGEGEREKVMGGEEEKRGKEKKSVRERSL